MHSHDAHSRSCTRRNGAPGRHDDSRARAQRPIPPASQRTPAIDTISELLGPMRWLGPARGADLSEAWGGSPGDAGWILELPDGGAISVTLSRKLNPAHNGMVSGGCSDARVVLFQEHRGYGGLTWCLPAETPQNLSRLREEISDLLQQGARIADPPRRE